MKFSVVPTVSGASRPIWGKILLRVGVVASIAIVATSGPVVAQAPPDDYGDQLDSSATSITLGTQISGRIDFSGDQDVFRFELTSGVGAIDAWFHTSGPVNDTVGALYDSRGNELVSNDDSVLAATDHHFYIGKTLGPGVYYVVVSGFEDAIGEYTLTSRDAKDQGNDFATAAALALDSPIDGIIDPGGDRDLFKLDLSSGSDKVRLALNTTGDVDTVGVLYHAHGGQIASNDDSELSENQANFFVAAAVDPGVYYLAVSGYGASAGPYRVYATNVPDQSRRPDQAASLPLNGSALGWLLSFNDVDRFEIDLAGETGNIDTWIYSVGAADTFGVLYRDDVRLVSNDNSVFSPNRPSFLIAENLAPATYQLSVSAGWTDYGPYRVFVRKGQDAGDDIATSGQLSLDARELGLLVPGDYDLYKLDLSSLNGATNIVLFSMGGVDTSGELLDSDGTTRLEQDADSGDGRNFAIRRELVPGVYYIRVAGQDGAQRGPYAVFAKAIGALEFGGQADGVLRSGHDEQFYQLEIATAANVWIYADVHPATGRTIDTVARLYDSNLRWVASNDNSSIVDRARAFSIMTMLSPGTYYLRVGSQGDIGHFLVRAVTVTEPGGSAATASALSIGEAAAAIMPASGGANYFRIIVDRDFPMLAYSRFPELTGQLLDANGTLIEQDSGELRQSGFTIREPVGPGTYYLKITAPGYFNSSQFPVRYAIHVVEDADYARLISQCQEQSAGVFNPAVEDDLYGCQWAFNNRSAVGEDINVEPVWAAGLDGTGINVVVVDDGMDHRHDDLRANVEASRNRDYTGNGDIYDYRHSHGTAVAGIIAARDNRIGVRGVAPRATLHGHNLLVNPQDANVLDAMTRNREITAVSNNSWGSRFGPELNLAGRLWEIAVDSSLDEGYGGKGTFYAFSGGNAALLGGETNLSEYPSYYGVTAVCAVNDVGFRSAYSSLGAPLWVCAPSDGASTRRSILTTANRDRYQDDFGGTSAAAPMVAGVAALLRQANPDLSWRDLKLILAACARLTDPQNSGWLDGGPQYRSTSSQETYSFNHEYGFGVVDAAAAVALAEAWVTAPKLLSAEGGLDDLDMEVPDEPDEPGGGPTIESAIDLDTDVTFVEFVEINVDFRHSSFRDLQIDLVSPSGKVSNLLSPVDTLLPIRLYGSMRLGSARHLGEDPNGTWTLRVVDRLDPHAGTLRSWSIKVYGHQSIPNSLTVDSATSADSTLTVQWSAPTVKHRTDSTWYDVRYIQTADDETVISNWDTLEKVWLPSSGRLSFSITGLSNEVQYDVQVRAVNQSGPGPWSGIVTATPTDHAPQRTLVGNSAQTRLPRPFVLNAGLQGIGQSFTTGPDPGGYVLQSIDVWVEGTHEARFIDLSGAIYSTRPDGIRGKQLVGLTHSGRFPSNRIKTFDAHSETMLLPNSEYMFVMECESGCANDNFAQFAKTGSNDEDAGTLAGWSLGNSVVKAIDDWMPMPNVTNSLAMSVTGSLANRPYIPGGGVNIISTPAAVDDTYRSGATIAFSVAFNTAVSVDTSGGTPRLVMVLGDPANGSRTVGLNYVRGNGRTTLEFEYVVQAGDVDSNGIFMGVNRLRLRGGTIKHATNGRDALWYHDRPGRNGRFRDHKVDGGLGPPSATLTDLTLSGIALSPQFEPGVTDYAATVANDLGIITVVASPETGATVSIQPADSDTAVAEHQVALDDGANHIQVVVTKSGAVPQTYKVEVTWLALPPPPHNLTAEPGDAQVALAWDPPGANASITHHEYRYKLSSQLNYGQSWIQIADSAPGGSKSAGLTVTGLVNGTLLNFQVRAVNSRGVSAPSGEATALTGDNLGICNRTTVVLIKILDSISGTDDCATVTTADLAGITGVFDFKNSLTGLRVGDFDGLSSLTGLSIRSNHSLTQLPNGIFDDLSSLTSLRLNDNGLTELPGGVFGTLSSLTELQLHDNQLASISDGFFHGLASLATLSLHGNSVDPLLLPISLETDGLLNIRAIVPAGAPFGVVLPLVLTNGYVVDGTRRTIIAVGNVKGANLPVRWQSGAAGRLLADIPSLPSPPGGHSGYRLSKSSDLPLTVATLRSRIASVAISSDPGQDRTYATGDVIDVVVTYRDPVAVDTANGIPHMALTIGDSVRNASYTSMDATAHALTFSYTVISGDSDQDGIAIAANALALNGGSITGLTGELEAPLDHEAVPDQGAHRVNKVPKIISRGVLIISSPSTAPDTYAADETIVLAVTFDSEVVVDIANGTPHVVIVFQQPGEPGQDKRLDYVRGSGNRTLEFEYVVQAGDRDDNGIQVNRNQLRADAGTIRHPTTGKDANLNHPMPGQNGNFPSHRVDGSLAASSLKLCGARLDTSSAGLENAEIDLCWDLGTAVPTRSSVIIELRSKYFWDTPIKDPATGDFSHWLEIGRGDSYMSCGNTGTCIRFTHGNMLPGQPVTYQMRLREGPTVLATSPEHKAQAPNSSNAPLNSELSGVFYVDSFESYSNNIATGTFRTDLTFTGPGVSSLITETVLGLEEEDFVIINGRVTGITADHAGSYVITVSPSTLGQPVTIILPDRKVLGIGEGLTAHGRSAYTRHNASSNTLTVTTAAP